MTSPCQLIQIECPGCGKNYETGYRASINLEIESFSDEYLEEISTGTCPNCGHKVDLDVLVVRDDGVWEFSE